MHLLDLKPAEGRKALQEWLSTTSQPKYRGKQVLEHLFERRQPAADRMSNLPRELRSGLSAELLPAVITCEETQVSVDGTRKYRFRLADGAIIESVWIPSDDRGTLCVSSQAGCPAGCTFCATAASGFKRNLRSSEIVSQWLLVGQDLERENLGRVTQVVFMGMGEPLFNYDNLAIALELLTSPEAFRFSPRRITVSTVGVPRRMEQLTTDFPQVRLALSLHSAIETTREEIVPLNRRYSVEDLRECLSGIADSARRVTLEYVVLSGINDSPAESTALAAFARECAGHVNLLPFHPFPGAAYPPTPPAAIRDFRDRVQQSFGGSVTIRTSRGLDISGACGQLALEALQQGAE